MPRQLSSFSIQEILATKNLRIAACERSPLLFGLYYFSKYMTHPAAPFHRVMATDLLFTGHDLLMWIMFRESAKTAWARIYVTWCIVYKKKRNIQWVGHDGDKAKANVSSIAGELMANERIISDFGNLYFEEKVETKHKKKRQKTIDKFVTANDVYVSAGTTQISTRGRLEDEFRPDLYVLDDIENSKTARSDRTTKAIISFLEELFGGLSADAKLLVLANRISRTGVVAYMEKRAANNPRWKVHDQPLLDTHNRITWSGKYVMSREEADAINSLRQDTKTHVKSVEQLRRDNGTIGFEREMQNQPADDGNIIKRDWIKFYEPKKLTQGEDGNWYYRFDGDEKATKGVCHFAIDPAVSKKETSDERVIHVGVHFVQQIKTETGTIKKNWYMVIKSHAGHWSVREFAEELAKLRDKYRPQKIGVESNGTQEAFRQIFQQFGISTIPLLPDADKVRRLSMQSADIEAGEVLFPNDGSSLALEDELVAFTGEAGKKDNRVDAFVYWLIMSKPKRGGFFFAKV